MSGQPQDWSWSPKQLQALPGDWTGNWNALPPTFRVFYGKALSGGASASLLRQIYEQLEGHSTQAGAELVNVMNENGLVTRIEGGQLVAVQDERQRDADADGAGLAAVPGCDRRG